MSSLPACLSRITRPGLFVLFLGTPLTGITQQQTQSADTDVLTQIYVIGSRGDIYDIPGSAHYLDHDDISNMAYDDINRVLQKVPGVYIREEDGYGLFPNLSLRGVDTTRSAKVTLMEDGILAAPAPYASPAAYYSPTTGRMDGLELLKGSSQVKYGPHITGGIVNYISTPIPEQQRVFLRAQYGEDNDMRVHGIYGNTVDTDAGKLGFVVEAYARDTDGFKQVDSVATREVNSETGFYNIEPMIKLAWEPASNTYQRIELKYGYTEKQADETYLGLGTADFRASPYRRYAASQYDMIDTEQTRTHLRYFVSPRQDIDVVTTAYYNEFARNWYKLNDLRSAAGGLTSNLDMSAALAGAQSGAGLSCLRGELACGLRVRANNREYYAWGVQSDLEWRIDTDRLSHEVDIGIRYHNDVEDRFQWDDVYAQTGTGAISGITRGIPGTQDNREAETGAWAIYVQDTIRSGNWIIKPGIRYETLDLENRDYRVGGTTRGAQLDIVSGGIGLVYEFSPELEALAGVHLGFSPPSPGGAVAGLEEESSTGYELGLRYANSSDTLMAEAVAFYTRFEDLIVISSIGGAGTGADENFGKVDSSGIELTGTYDLGLASDWAFSNRYFIAFTYTNAEQQNDASSTDPESIFSFGVKGNKVPYIPEYQISLGTNLDFTNWGGAVSASFVDETFTSASNVETEVNGAGLPDARFGTTDSYSIADLSLYFKPLEHTKLFAGVHNLFDEAYMVSRQPHGPRPGMPRSWYAGLEIEY
jgi:Fe(3+) dicitrate transport protein